jgi:flagellin
MGAFADATTVTTTATVTLSSTDTIVVDDNIGAAGNVLAGDDTTTKALTGTAISLIDISSVSGASTAITSIDAALSTISSTRSDLGSYQSRFESIVANSQTAAENLSASRSRIMDADFAQETAQLTKSQILQQSGIAMLAQANSIPQNVLALLQ